MVLISVVHYNNGPELHEFIDHIRKLEKAEEVIIIISDNSGNYKYSNIISEQVFYFKPKENLGYLNGCYYGIKQWKLKFHHDWDKVKFIIIANTDVKLDNAFFPALLRYDSLNEIGCIAPKIILPNGSDQNPNIENRVSITRIKFLKFIYSYTLLGSAYIYLHKIKIKFRLRKIKSTNKRIIYAPHGAFMIFTEHFKKIDDLHFEGFMLDEELHIAEELFKANLKVLYDPILVLHHSNHSATKLISIKRYVKWHYDSISKIHKKYFDSSGII